MGYGNQSSPKNPTVPDDGCDCLDDEVSDVASGDLLDVSDGAGGHEGGGLGGRVDAPRDGGHMGHDEHLHHLGSQLLQIRHSNSVMCDRPGILWSILVVCWRMIPHLDTHSWVRAVASVMPTEVMRQLLQYIVTQRKAAVCGVFATICHLSASGRLQIQSIWELGVFFDSREAVFDMIFVMVFRNVWENPAFMFGSPIKQDCNRNQSSSDNFRLRGALC